jgi:hypothetical protein
MSSNNNPDYNSSDKNPSDNIPSNNNATPASSADNAPDDITLRLAFRTITTMLDFFQYSSVDGQHKPMTVKKDVNTNDPDQSHLQLLNALSIVLVRQHEVVSVVSNRSSGHLDLLACSQPDPEPNNLTTDSPNNHSEDIYYVTANPRIVNPKGRSRENEAHIVADALRYCGQYPCILKARPELIQSVTLENVMWYMHTAQ